MITAASFAERSQEAVSRVDKKAKDYVKSPDEENVHDLRTAIRRMDASLNFLPNKFLNRKRTQRYRAIYKRLFRLNTKVRDMDIILAKLRNYYPATILPPPASKLIRKIERWKKKPLKKAQKLTRKLSSRTTKGGIPKVSLNDLNEAKLQARFNRKLVDAEASIDTLIPVILKNGGASEDLHSLRVLCKGLWYALELVHSQSQEHSDLLDSLRGWQDVLGEIHDSDVAIAYFQKKKKKRRYPLQELLEYETRIRKQKFESFAETCERKFEQDKELIASMIQQTSDSR